MNQYNIDKLSKEEIFGGKIIAPMRQWLVLHNEVARNYNYRADMAIITHYLQNKSYPEGLQYKNEALPLMEKYYRATHTEIKDDEPFDSQKAEDLFSVIYDTPVYKQHRSNNSFTFVDLFAGIGGFRIALEQLGGRCVYASEFDIVAQRSYGLNHGVVPFGDIKLQENKDRIPDNVDVLCAGFPCQPFSLAGLRLGFSDKTKGTLFYDLKEIIEAKQPRMILLENVPGLLSINNRDENGIRLSEKTIDTILHILREELHYYVPDPEVLNAKDFGVAQNRARVFIVGFRDKDQTGNFAFPTGDSIPPKYFGEIREPGKVNSGYYMSERYWQTLVNHKISQRNNGRGYGYKIVKDNEFGHTLMVGVMGLERNLVKDTNNPDVIQMEDHRGELNHEYIRVLTERECARMQGFPEYFEIAAQRSAAYRQFGNSVAIPVVNAVARCILEYDGVNHANID